MTNPNITDSPNMELICTPLHQMTKMHPNQIERPCFKCGQPVGIYPTGQMAMRRYPQIKIICLDCVAKTPFDAKYDEAYAAGAPEEVIQEMRESKDVISQ